MIIWSISITVWHLTANLIVERRYFQSFATVQERYNQYYGVTLFKVLHHLDKDGSDGKIHMYQKALLEAKRVLSPHGVLIISTCLPVIIEEAFWFTQIHQYYKEKVASPLLSVEEYLAIFDRTGFECVAAMNLLATKMPSMFRNYFDSDGPLKAEWRIGTSMFESYGDQLLNEMETSFLKLKEQGKLKKFMEDHDRTAEIGMVTVFACVAKGSKTFKDLASGYP